jgi:multidrug efflux pump subunit AcrA (membrane-fusion protein)
MAGLFRAEALRYRAERTTDGELLDLSSDWTRWTYWLLAAAFAAGLIYCVTGALHEYATGPAVVWFSGRTQVTASVAGTVEEILVSPREAVEAGQVLVRFSSAVEAADLGRIDREFELVLAKSLGDPADQTTKATLTALRTERDVAAARLGQLSIRAPHAGVIGDVRIRAGQLMSAGDVVVTLVSPDQRGSVLVVMPAQYRPQLAAGLTMRFEVRGYRYAYQELAVSAVGTQIIGPNEVKRYLGQEIQDTITIEGPVVLIEAKLASSTFMVDGETFHFFHGMSGTGEVRVRTESVLFSLVPGLRVMFERTGT